MSSLCVKFQPSSTPPTERFWWGVLVLFVLLVLVLVVLVTGVKQSQLLVLRLSLEFDNIIFGVLMMLLLVLSTKHWRPMYADFFKLPEFRKGIFLLIQVPDILSKLHTLVSSFIKSLTHAYRNRIKKFAQLSFQILG